MVMFVWLEDTQTMRDVWKCVLVDTGDMSVTMDFIPHRLWLYASSCLKKTSVRQTIVVNCVFIVCTQLYSSVHVFCFLFRGCYIFIWCIW